MGLFLLFSHSLGVLAVVEVNGLEDREMEEKSLIDFLPVVGMHASSYTHICTCAFVCNTHACATYNDTFTVCEPLFIINGYLYMYMHTR